MMMLIESEIGTTHRHKTYATRLIKKKWKNKMKYWMKKPKKKKKNPEKTRPSE